MNGHQRTPDVTNKEHQTPSHSVTNGRAEMALVPWTPAPHRIEPISRESRIESCIKRIRSEQHRIRKHYINIDSFWTGPYRIKLYLGTVTKYSDTVQSLLKAGVNINAIDENGLPPLDYAAVTRRKEQLLMMQEAKRVNQTRMNCTTRME